MKEYLKENIDFNKLLFSTTITIVSLLIASIYSILVQNGINYKLKFVISLFLFLIIVVVLILISILYRNIKEDIIKLKKYE